MPRKPSSPPAPPATFLARVRLGLATFRPMERRLAEFVIDFPGELASYAASELAALAGVSNATVSRFIRRLGYQDYEEARRHAREEREVGSPLYLASRDAVANAGPDRHLAASEQNLRRTLARLDAAQVDGIARALLAARKVWVVGYRSSRSFATYLRWQLFQVKEDIEVVPHAGDTLGQYVASIARQDVVVAFGLRRRVAGLRETLSLMAESCARILYVTDEQLARHPDVTWHIHCRCHAESALDDHVAVIAVCHLLASRTFELAGAAQRARLASIEASHGRLREL